jgi:3-oxoacyl-[acyl-carrier-protein] synthase-3
MAQYAHITGWGMAVPPEILTNDDLAKKVETDDQWIVDRTGIRQRHIAGADQTTADLATEAALKALETANLSPSEVDLIICSTSSPEHIFPATACLVQDRLGAGKAGAFDLSAACSGFIFALNMASQAIRTGSVRNALVIGAETLSKEVDWTDRGTCILFGDGAGAFVLQGAPERGGVLSSVMHSDGSGSDLLILPGGGSKHPATVESVQAGLHFIKMEGRDVFRFATRAMASATQEALAKAQLTLQDIQLIIPHQANLRIIEAAAKNLGVSMDLCMVNLDRYGNTSTASIPIAACEAVEQGRLKPGDRVVFVGFGAGLTWGAAVATWSGPFPGVRRILPLHLRWYTRWRSALRRLLRRLDTLLLGDQ